MSTDTELWERLFNAADDMPDEVACERIGADRYADEFKKLRDAVAAIRDARKVQR